MTSVKKLANAYMDL